MNNVYLELDAMIEELKERLLDAHKFDEGNFRAGTRITKALIKTSKKAKDLRQFIFAVKKQRSSA